MVKMTNQVFHSCLLCTVDTPKNMKMTVSEEDANIFMAYLMVVWDFVEIFCST